MIVVAIAPSLIWPSKKPAAGRLSGSADSAALRDSVARLRATPQPADQPAPDAPGLVVYAGQGTQSLHLEAARGGSRVTLEYRFTPDVYRFEVRGNVTGLSSGGAVLLIGLSNGLRSAEKDSLDDYRHYAVVTKASKAERTDFSKLRPDQRALLDGPFEWVGVKSKY